MIGPLLIIGAAGLVGSGLAKAADGAGIQWTGTRWKSANPPEYLECSIEDPESVSRVVRRTAPAVVALTAALTNVDYCETHPDEAEARNVEGTRNVALAAREAGAKMIFFSTDYVFDGMNGPYDENAAPRPINVYGRTKLDGERVVLDTCPGAIVVRTTVVYGWRPGSKNFLMQLDEKLSAGIPMRVPGDQIGSPTETDFLGGGVLALIEKKREGIFNVTGPDLMSRYEFALMAADELGLDRSLISAISTPELRQDANRPLNAGLLTEKFCEATGMAPMTTAEGLLKFKRERDAQRAPGAQNKI